jgi:multicomponent Na+:H+ antiporter subunit F
MANPALRRAAINQSRVRSLPQFYLGVAVFLLLTLAGGLQRILRGPSRADRMLAAQLFGSTGVAILLLIAEATGGAGVRDVALIFAILAVVNVVAFVHHAWREGE